MGVDPAQTVLMYYMVPWGMAMGSDDPKNRTVFHLLLPLPQSTRLNLMELSFKNQKHLKFQNNFMRCNLIYSFCKGLLE